MRLSAWTAASKRSEQGYDLVAARLSTRLAAFGDRRPLHCCRDRRPSPFTYFADNHKAMLEEIGVKAVAKPGLFGRMFGRK